MKLVKEVKDTRTVWDTPKLRKLVAQPLGAPIELTREQADEIVRLAFGRRPDLRRHSRHKASTAPLPL
ncbi:MAG: hypothetical protein HYX92_09740 [Chloroflexi bacterium]|nr:hypothetical protein [Chloroflexota bacterium]